jgi:hypothetical protein
VLNLRAYDYCTDFGRKRCAVKDYIKTLPKKENVLATAVIVNLQLNGANVFTDFGAYIIEDSLWAIEITDNCVIYLLVLNTDTAWLLHACPWLKGKAEKSEIQIAKSRATEILLALC